MKRKFTHYLFALLIVLFAIPISGMSQAKIEKKPAHICASKECKHDKKPHVCRSTEQHEAYWKANPEAHKAFLLEQEEQKRLVNQLKTRSLSRLKATATSQKYIIPVVFHVFGETQSGKAVTYDLIEDALRRTNEDFAQQSVGQDQIHPRFQGVLDNLSVEFRLAKKEPNGNLCDGVNFYPVKSGFGNRSSDTEIQAYAWDNKKYMNVYIMNDLYADGDLYQSGVAWYPTQSMTDSNTARVVFNGAYIGNNGSENFRRILTHEFGHFFNLIHTFEGGCPEANGGDQCADTPAATKSQMGVDELNCNGEYTNTQNFMNYTSDYEMFTKDQVLRMTAAMDHSARITLWQPDNLIATGVNDGFEPGMIVTYDSYSIREAIINDGSTDTKLHINLTKGAEFENGTFIEGTHFKSLNVPAGLSVDIKRTDAANAVLSFTGKAVNNEKEHSVSGMTIELLQPAFTTPINQINNTKIDKFKIDFRSVYETKYISLDKSITGVGTWKYIDLAPVKAECYIWHYDQDPEKKFKLDMEINKNSVLNYAGTHNIVPLNFGDEISSTSSWYKYTVNGEQADIYNNSFTEWKGKRKYIGIQLQHDNDTYNGWMSASISADGNTFTVHDAAYYTKPNATILAGKAHEAILKFDADTLNEDSFNNNGRLGNFITAKLMNTTFSVAENTILTAGTHYSITGVPAGLTPEIKILPNDYLQIKLKGYAQNHNKVDLTKVNITFFDVLFDGLPASEIKNAVDAEINIKYIDEYKVVYYDMDDITVDKNNNWKSFVLGESENNFGAWYHEGNLRFETYERDVVGHIGMLDAKILALGTSIGSNTDVWVTPGAFPDEMYITDTNHKEWIGNEGYLGCVVNLNGNRCYAWIRIEVDAAGQSYTVKDWAYNEQPNAPIIAGETTKPTQVSVSISEATFTEPYTNDGSVEGIANISVLNDEFALAAGTVLTNGTHFSVTNLPEGLACKLEVVDYNNMKLSLNGNAVSNTKPESAVVEISFKDPVFVNGSAGTVENNSLNFDIKFKEPWDIIYTDVNDITVSASNEFKWFGMAVGTHGFGAWWYNKDGRMKLETYENYIICSPGTSNLIPLSEGSSIGANSSEWYQGKDWPNEPDLDNANYHAWLGKEAYVGVRLKNGEFNHFGWIRIAVAADAMSYTVLDYAFNDQPDTPILAGQKTSTVSDDTEAPTVPSNLAASEITQTSVRLDWNTSTDNVAVTLYEILSEGLVIGSSATNSIVVSGLNANITYSFTVRAKDAAGNVSNESMALAVTTSVFVDTEAPTVPSNLAASEITQTSVRLDWNASTDNVAVTGYEIESAGLVIASSATNSVVVSGLVANTNYSFTVKAKDAAKNTSVLSTPVSFKTLSDNSDYCSMVGTDYSYEWITEVVLGSFSKNSAVDNGYGDFTADIVTAEAGSSLNISLTPNSAQYTEHWKVWIDYNGNGNFSDSGEEVFSGSAKGALMGSITIPADATGSTRLRVAMRYNNAPVLCENPNSGEVEDYTINFEGAPIDVTPPTVPGNLTATTVTQTSISLDWAASTDDNGIKNYEVLSSGTVVSTGVATSTTVNNLSANTTYSFTVRATDPSGNVSNESTVLTVTTLGDISYCDASGSQGPEHIAKVLFEGINNSSVRDAYRDYTAMSANVSQGNTYPITVTIGDYYNGDRATVWFDWNQDGIFNSAEEQLILTPNGAEASGSVLVPVGASLGNTRMRVRVHYYESGAVPCHVQTYGEVEDYTIHVSGSAQNMTKTKSLESVDMMPDSETQVKLYPNPVVDHLKIRANNIKNVKVFNVTGKLVLAANNDGNLLEMDMNFSELQEGLYLVRIELNNNELITKKVVK